MQKILSVCGSCRGTGLYEGFCEKEGYPVVCLNCRGTGCQEISYEPFVERKKKNGVKGVSLSKGSFIWSGIGPVGEVVSYQDFLDGKIKYQ